MAIACPSCSVDVGSESVYQIERAPVLNNATYGTEQEALDALTGTIDLAACSQCGMVFNRVFDETLPAYDGRYDNGRGNSPAYCSYLDELVAKVAQNIGQDARILEVGCGNGDFLIKLSEKTGASAFGYDRTYTGEFRRGKATFFRDYFVPTTYGMTYDVFVLRHVLEHVPRPYAFLKEISAAGALVDGAKIFIEVPDIEWIVDHGAFYDITYEHCNYFSRTSLTALVTPLGFHHIQTTNVFGGQYILLEAVHGAEMAGRPQREIAGAPLREFKNTLDASRQKNIERLCAAENLCVWGASGKGVLFLNALSNDLLGRVKCVVDINRNKQGRFLPVSAKRVDSPAALKGAQGPVDVVVMNEVYKDEVVATLKDLGVQARVLTC